MPLPVKRLSSAAVYLHKLSGRIRISSGRVTRYSIARMEKKLELCAVRLCHSVLNMWHGSRGMLVFRSEHGTGNVVGCSSR